MEPKNIEAIARGREYMLARFANLPIPCRGGPQFIQCASVTDCAVADRAVQEFCDQFSELSPGMGPHVDMIEWHKMVISFRSHWCYWKETRRDPRHRRPLSYSVQLRGEGRELTINDPD